MRILQEKQALFLIPNLYEGIMGNRELMSDPIHPNAKGYETMAQTFHDAVKPYM